MNINHATPTLVSGIAATGNVHIGNYIGAISQWIDLQKRYESYLFLADLHSLTVPDRVESDVLRRLRIEVPALYLACGLDPVRTTIFRQSEVSAHAELAWLLTCLTPVGWLERMTQFKTRRNARQSTGAGLLTYPVLQASDILLYRANSVPVGEDQIQHVELARDIAGRFNAMFGSTFTLPNVLLPGVGARVMGLDDPAAKMSKSTAYSKPEHAVFLLDPPDVVASKIMRAVTDSGREVGPEGKASLGVKNLITIYAASSGIPLDQAWDEFSGESYRELKSAVVESLVAVLDPIRQRYSLLARDPGYVEAILDQGAQRAHAIAADTLARAYRAVGLQ